MNFMNAESKNKDYLHLVPVPKKVPAELNHYYEVREELSVADGVLMRSERVVVPAKLTATFVQLDHESHPGIMKTKQHLC